MESSYNQVNATSKIPPRLKNFTRVVSALTVSRSLACFCRRNQKMYRLRFMLEENFEVVLWASLTTSLWTDRDNGHYVLNTLNVVIVKVATSFPPPQPVLFFWARLGAKSILLWVSFSRLKYKFNNNLKSSNNFVNSCFSHRVSITFTT